MDLSIFSALFLCSISLLEVILGDGNGSEVTDVPGEQKLGTINKGYERSVAEKNLRERLLQDYEKSIMPNSNDTTLFQLRIGMILTGIQAVDVKKQRVAVSAWMKLEWYDGRITWNSSEHSNIFSLPFSFTEVYIPEILLFNRYRARDTQVFGQTMVIAYFHGEMIWLPPSSLDVPCSMDMSKWPFDSHECQFIFGHASRDNRTFEMRPESMEVEFEKSPINSAEWIVASTRVRRYQSFSNVGDNYDNVRFFLTFERIPRPFLRSVFFAPQIIMWMSLCIFWIADQNFRLLFGIVELIVASALAASFWSIMPQAHQVPSITYLISGCPTLILIALALTLMIDCLNGFTYPLPRWVAAISAAFRKLDPGKVSNGSTDQSSVRLSNGPHRSSEHFGDWSFVALLVRALVFSLYFLACCLLALLTYFL